MRTRAGGQYWRLGSNEHRGDHFGGSEVKDMKSGIGPDVKMPQETWSEFAEPHTPGGEMREHRSDTIAAKCVQAHLDHPEWSSRDIADRVGCESEYVRTAVARAGLSLKDPSRPSIRQRMLAAEARIAELERDLASWKAEALSRGQEINRIAEWKCEAERERDEARAALKGIRHYAEEMVTDIAAEMQEGGLGIDLDAWNAVIVVLEAEDG